MGIKRLCGFLHDMNVVKHYDTLNDFMENHFKKNSYTNYCKLGIDSSVYIRRYMHVHGKYYTLALLKQSLGFLLHNVIPVYIFDGKPPDGKKDVIQQRRVRRNKNKMRLKNVEQQRFNFMNNHEYISNKIYQSNYEKEILRIKRQLVQIHKQDVINIKEMLNICNIPYIQSTEEADPMLGELYRQGFIDIALSYDMDLLLKGCDRVISFTAGGHIYEYNLDYILDGLKLTYAQFIDMCILFGCEEVKPFININKPDDTNEILNQHDIYSLIIKHQNIEGIIIALYGKHKNVSSIQIAEYLEKCNIARYNYNNRNIELV